MRVSRSVHAVFFLVVSAVFYSHSATAADGPKGFFWEVYDSKNAPRGYLMGAFHLATTDFYPLQSSILSAFSRSSVLMVEADEQATPAAEQAQLIERYAMYPEGSHYRDYLPKQTVDQLETLFLSLGIAQPEQLFARYRPGLLGVTLAALQAQALGYSPDYGIDRYFLDKARYKKEIQEIESFEFQIRLIGNLVNDSAMFGAALIEMSDYESEWAGLENAWYQGDAERLYDLAIGNALRDFPELTPYYDTLFFDRNEGMSEAAIKCMDQQVCFVVVGAGHLVGERGVIDLMSRKGYTIKQIK